MQRLARHAEATRSTAAMRRELRQGTSCHFEAAGRQLREGTAGWPCERTLGFEARRLPAPSHVDTLHDQGAQLHAVGGWLEGGIVSMTCMPQVVIYIAALDLLPVVEKGAASV